MFKKIYRFIIPELVRKSFWDIKNAIHYISSERGFSSTFNYELYWELHPKTYSPNSLGALRCPIVSDIVDNNSTVLDVGCGSGALLNYLKKKKKIDELGIDVSQKAVDHACTNGIHAENWILPKDKDKLGFYDYVLLMEVLEHMSNSEEIFDILSKKFNKLLIVSLPNVGYLPCRLRLLFGKFPRQWVFHPSEHLRFWTLKDFLFWVDKFNLNVNKIIPYYGFSSSMLRKLMPNLFASNILIVLSKKS